MKNKAGYILLPLVVAVWGLIGYKVISFLKQDTVSISEAKAEQINISPNNFVQDTFLIAANYPDPFLQQQMQQHVVTTIPQAKPVIKPVIKSNTPWPVISYLGLVKNHKSNKALAIVMFNKKLNNLATGDEIDGALIMDIQRDSLIVKYNGERKVFGRGKK